MKQSSIAYMITNKMPKKEKILILHKQLGEYFCSQAEKIGLEPIHFYSKEWGDILEFKVNIWTKCENIFRRILFKDKTFIDRKYCEYHHRINLKRLKKHYKKALQNRLYPIFPCRPILRKSNPALPKNI